MAQSLDLFLKNMAKHSKDNQSTPPDPSTKKDSVTSTFSAATSDQGRYGGEDTGELNNDTGDNTDKLPKDLKTTRQERPIN